MPPGLRCRATGVPVPVTPTFLVGALPLGWAPRAAQPIGEVDAKFNETPHSIIFLFLILHLADHLVY